MDNSRSVENPSWYVQKIDTIVHLKNKYSNSIVIVYTHRQGNHIKCTKCMCIKMT